MSTHATPTFITEELHLVTQVQLLLTNCGELLSYIVLAYSYCVSFCDAKATPINDTG